MGLISLDYITNRVSAVFGVPTDQILGRSRKGEYILSRHAFFLIAMANSHSSVKVGRFTGKDHATILHGAKRARDRMLIDESFKSKIDVVSRDLKEYLYLDSKNPIQGFECFDIATELDELGQYAIRLAKRLRRGQNGLSRGVRDTLESVSEETGKPEIPGVQGMAETNEGNPTGDDPGGSR